MNLPHSRGEANAILVLAAHPDDEVLGCGGTMARHAAAGDSVEVVFFTNGTGARGASGKAAKERAVAMRKALKILGAKLLAHFDFPDNQLDVIPTLHLAQALEKAVGNRTFDVVYTHHAGDLNVDHRKVHDATLTCFRPQPGPRQALRILSYEVLSSTGWGGTGRPTFNPNVFIDISCHLATKERALACYSRELRPFPHARSLEALRSLATYRGAMNGLNPSEAFLLLREIHAATGE